MLSVISADLQQNLITTIYLLFSHNYIALMYFLGMCLGIALSLYRPSRFTTMILLGFAILLFSYEYDKHLIEGLREQTIKSLITITPHYRLQRLIDVIISQILPIFFYLVGWIFVFLAIISASLKLSDKQSKKGVNQS